MIARSMITGAAFGPDAMKVVGQAFDEAWDQIAGSFGGDPTSIERARIRLAEALLSLATDESREVEPLKRGALEAMARRYKCLYGSANWVGDQAAS
jgi:hypothetical protein